MGFDLRVQGKRFPLTTTLNELGEDWSFNSGDIKDQKSGAYDGQRYWRIGNFYTSEWYEAGTKRKFYDTSVELSYRGVPVLAVGIDDFREDGKYTRDTKIDGIFDGNLERENKLWGFSINGIHMGDALDKSIERQCGRGEWKRSKHDKMFVIKKNRLSIYFFSALKDKGKTQKEVYKVDSISIGPDKKRSKTAMGSE